MARSRFVFGLAFASAILLFLHLFHLNRIPGMHFDEAWAANFAWDIAFKPGYWPIHAMSPYTMAWTHYFAAAFFRILGVSLFSFRISQISLALLGIIFLSLELFRRHGKNSTLFFLFLCIGMPALLFNQRFAIELNSFHVLCLGLVFFFYGRGNFILALLVAAFGITSHILFLAPILGVLGERLLQDRPWARRERLAWIVWALAFIPYFISVAHLIPEAAKAWALGFLMLGIAVFLAVQGELLLLRFRKQLEILLAILAIPFLLNLLFFSAGEWTLSVNTGHAFSPWMAASTIMVMICFGFLLWRSRMACFGFLLCVSFSGLMMLKPTPRYFECSLLWLAFLVAPQLSLPRFRKLLLGAFLVNSILVYSFYFSLPTFAREMRFLSFHDNSRDFLRKQDLVEALGLSGCALSDIKSVDSRILEALRFLSHGDWPTVNETCPWRDLIIEADSSAIQTKFAMNQAGFVIWGTQWKKMDSTPQK